MGDRWARVVEACSEDAEECRKAVRLFLEEMCRDPSMCREPRRGLVERYSWVEELIRRGVPDGRSRLILYIVSRYLVNVKNLDPESAVHVVEEFIENSCRNHGNCGKIYRSWIRNVLRHVKEGGWLPWKLETLKERDPELYAVVESVLSGRDAT
ncbi:MAG: DNA primase noncatalytic subunit PriX [Desulfurococcales archaeon]|nr:DNA primase noncatalytic subunit PriX [Desulfurococcales archaeon]